jgi:hypothetical protein
MTPFLTSPRRLSESAANLSRAIFSTWEKE